jgi:hypothetical protein
VGVGPKRDLALSVGAAHPRALDRQTPAAEGHLAALPPVAVSCPLGVVPSPRADDLLDLLVHQLAEHAEPDAVRQRHQPLLSGTGELAEGVLDTRGQLAAQALLRGRGLRDRYVLLHGGSSFDLSGIAPHAPSGSRRGRRDRRQVLRATGHPRRSLTKFGRKPVSFDLTGSGEPRSRAPLPRRSALSTQQPKRPQKPSSMSSHASPKKSPTSLAA